MKAQPKSCLRSQPRVRVQSYKLVKIDAVGQTEKEDNFEWPKRLSDLQGDHSEVRMTGLKCLHVRNS